MRTLLLSISLVLAPASGIAQQATPAVPPAGSPAATTSSRNGGVAPDNPAPVAAPPSYSPRLDAAPPDRQQAPAAKSAAPAPPAPNERARPAESGRKAAPVRRRSLQAPQHVPLVGAPAPRYGPTPAAPVPLQPGAVSGPAGLPPPAQINSCVGNLCTDSAGATYNSGAGNAAVNAQGRLCNRVGNTMQCF